jgi:hypothetical protein
MSAFFIAKKSVHVCHVYAIITAQFTIKQVMYGHGSGF